MRDTVEEFRYLESKVVGVVKSGRGHLLLLIIIRKITNQSLANIRRKLVC